MDRKILRGVLALAILLVLALAACGKDKEADKTANVTNHDAQTRYNLGDPAPDFTLPTADGRTISLADYKDNKPVLLFFHMAVG